MSLAPLRQRNGELEQQLAACRSALALAQQELDRLAGLDNLTQTANRRRFDQRLYHEWKRLAREKQPLSLILVEIDRFRAYGDRYGPLAADQCLYRVAQMLRAIALRPADLVSRYSGEVFALLLPGTPVAGAEALAQRIHRGMFELQIDFKLDGQQELSTEPQCLAKPRSPSVSQVTLSLGLASTCPQGEMLPTTLLEYANEALLEAKAGRGGDRTPTGVQIF